MPKDTDYKAGRTMDQYRGYKPKLPGTNDRNDTIGKRLGQVRPKGERFTPGRVGRGR
jgi:hypothetical protein